MKIRDQIKQVYGFTLIEMMIVVLIIVTLIAIMIPVVGTMREKARAAATRERMGTISTGLEAYKIDFGFYPPSTPTAFKNSSTNKLLMINSGSAMLAEALLGYLPYEYDGAGKTAPGSVDADDFGFRKSGKGSGNKYGPYTDANAVPKVAGSPGGTIRVDTVPLYTVNYSAYGYTSASGVGYLRMCYLDGYGNEILYYRGTDTINPTYTFGAANVSVFVNDDNSAVGVAASAPPYNPAGGTARFFASMQAGSANSGAGAVPGGALGRNAYILVSPHRDGIYFNDDDVVGPLR